MDEMNFKAFAVTSEIDLNKIASQCSIPKKYTWEEPLILQDDLLNSAVYGKSSPNSLTPSGRNSIGAGKVLIFSFGSIVFMNMNTKEISAFLDYFDSFKLNIDLKSFNRYSDDYCLHVGKTDKIEFSDEYVTVPGLEAFYPELISIVIAKSVALEKIEEQLGGILDKLETMIDRLEKGKLRISDKELARTTAKVVRHEYNSIAYIMILDKPDITWTTSAAAEFYDKMSNFFELNDRYEIIKSKTEILNNIIDGFSSISHSIRGLFLEGLIVLLIVAEVILMFIEIIK